MKKIFVYILTAAALTFVSCDKIFDSLEGDLSKMDAETLAGSTAGLDRLMASLYSNIPMGAFAEGDKNTVIANDSNTSGSYSGGVYSSSVWNYTYVRDINMFLQTLETAKEKSVVTEEEYNTYKGEALFMRAYYYFANVRIYGGVPIVTEPLDDKFEGADKPNEGLYIPRSKEKETWDFVLSELDTAISLLPENNPGGKYRATKWAALGLKSRVALWAASVCKYWGNAPIATNYQAVQQELALMKSEWATGYYDQSIAASEAIINSHKFALYKSNPASVEEAIANYTNLFLARQDEEFIFGRSYKNGVTTNSNGIDLKNSPFQAHGSGTGVWRFGCYGVTLDLVDEYDNYNEAGVATDGTVVTRTDGHEDVYFTNPSSPAGSAAIYNDEANFVRYQNPADAFKNKDARFHASVIYPGINFRNTNIVIQGGLMTDDMIAIYDESNPSVDFWGTTVYMNGAKEESQYSGFHKMGRTNDGSWYTTGFGLRKFLDPVNKVDQSQNPWYDIRYAEILLNYCEAIVEKSGTNAGNSKEYLNAIRHRAAFKGDVDANIANILHERTVELAFEDDFGATQYRRRAYFNLERDGSSNPNGGRKHALIPVMSLKNAFGGGYGTIFVRANCWDYDTNVRPAPASFNSLSYYSGIPNYNTTNKLVPNPVQE